MLTREELLGRITYENLEKESVEVPEWGGAYFVRCLTAGELDDFESSLFEEVDGKRKPVNVRAKLVCRAVCNEDGSRLFLDADSLKLGRERCEVIDRIYGIAQRLSGRTEDERALIEKNSESDQKPDSP